MRALGYFYSEEEAGRRAAAKLLTRDEARRLIRDEARRLAANFAKLLELLGRKPNRLFRTVRLFMHHPQTNALIP